MNFQEENSDLQSRLGKLERRFRRYKRKTKRNHRGRSSSRSRSRSFRRRETSTDAYSDSNRQGRHPYRSRSPRAGRTSSSASTSPRSSSPTSPERPNIPKPAQESVEALSVQEVEEVFGKRIYDDQRFAPDILPDLAVRLKDIIENGIPEDSVKDLVQKYTPPSNCKNFHPPELNPLINGVVSEAVIARDKRIVNRQKKISSALSANVKVTSIILALKDIPQWKEILECLGDATKLLSDLQFEESLIRKKLISANVDSSMKEMLQSATTDEYLFGKNLEEKIKSAKALQSAGKDLQKKSVPKVKSDLSPSRETSKKNDGVSKRKYTTENNRSPKRKYSTQKRKYKY